MSLNANTMAELMKEAAAGMYEASKPFSFCLGKVISAGDSLRIRIDQKLVLGSKQLLLTNSVRDYYVKLTTCGETTEQSDGTAHKTECSVRPAVAPEDYGAFDNHNHEYKGDKWFKVNLALKAGESVILLRTNGGQKYIVLDRVEAPENV